MRAPRGFAAITCLMVGMSGCTTPTAQPRSTPQSHQRPTPAPARRAQPTPDAVVRWSVTIGFSVDRRAITAVEIGDPDTARRAVVVGCIHGNESSGIAITRALMTLAVPPEVDLWVIPDLNPDGLAADTRANADGVDLNRNFLFRWRPLGPPGSTSYAGSGPLSEPESRAVSALLRRVRPTLGIWYHQALTVVDISQGPRALERRYAIATGLPTRSLIDYPGSAVGDEDHRYGPTAFVVELPPGPLSRAQSLRHARAVLDLATKSS